MLDHGAVKLEIVPAEEHPTRDLYRITYECDGEEVDGIAAVGRALEHINFAWAMVGFFMQLPIVRQALQVLSDGTIAGPQRVRRAIK